MSRFYNLDQAPFNGRELSKAIVAAITGQYNGAFFDAQDLSTMYQDAAGTTPVTAMEQPVGLWLDKSQGVQLGPEFAPSLADSSQWTDIITGVVISNGVLSYSGVNITAGTPCVTGVGTERANRLFKVTYTLNSISGFVSLGWAGVAAGTARNSAGTYTEYITVPVGAVVRFGVIARIAGTTAFNISNISVRELKGNHATQSITASRPVISARKNLLLATDVLSTQSVTAVAAQYALSFTGTGSVTLSGAATGALTGTGANNRVSLPFTPAGGGLTLTVSGDVRLAQLEYSPVATSYQRVNTATDYDTVGFHRYLRGDGVDDHLVLPYLGLYANSGASVFSAISLLRQTTNSCLLSEGNSADTDSLYCMTRQLASGGNLDSTIVRDDATVLLDTTGSGSSLADGTTSVRGFIDTGSNVKLFKNSQQLTSDNYIRSGTVTLNNTIIGGKVSSTNSMFGSFNLYGLIIAKSVLSDGDRRKLEVFLANKAGISV